MNRKVWTYGAALAVVLGVIGGIALFTPGESLAIDGGWGEGGGNCFCGFKIYQTPVLGADGSTCQAATWNLASKLEAYAPSIDGYCFQEFDFEECRPNTMGNGYWINGSMRYKPRTCI